MYDFFAHNHKQAKFVRNVFKKVLHIENATPKQHIDVVCHSIVYTNEPYFKIEPYNDNQIILHMPNAYNTQQQNNVFAMTLFHMMSHMKYNTDNFKNQPVYIANHQNRKAYTYEAEEAKHFAIHFLLPDDTFIQNMRMVYDHQDNSYDMHRLAEILNVSYEYCMIKASILNMI